RFNCQEPTFGTLHSRKKPDLPCLLLFLPSLFRPSYSQAGPPTFRPLLAHPWENAMLFRTPSRSVRRARSPRHPSTGFGHLAFRPRLVALESRDVPTAFDLGSASGESVLSVKFDNAGNAYVCGGFHNTVDFDPGPGTFNLTATVNGDGFLAKYTATGTLVWATKFDQQSANAVAIDPSGNVLLTGITQVSNGQGGLASVPIVSKFTSDGAPVWSKLLDTGSLLGGGGLYIA